MLSSTSSSTLKKADVSDPPPAVASPPEEKSQAGCGILGRYPILTVIVFASLGIAIGIGLSAWDPENPDTKTNLLKWIGLIGDLFIRSLKAVVLPLVFVNVATSVVDMMMMGRASSVGVTTIVLYTCTTVAASIIGLLSILSFQSLFEPDTFDEEITAFIALGCTEEGSLLTENTTDGSIMCMPNGNLSSPLSQFQIIDLTAGLTRSNGDGLAEISMSDTIYDGVFTKVVTDNIFFSFVDGNFAAVVIFAIVFGVALGRCMFEKKQQSLNASFVVLLFTELGDILLKMINWIIAVTPFAVLSLIANAIGSQDDLSGAFRNVGYLIAACLVGFVVHFFLVDVGLLYVMSRENPFPYLRQMIPAQMTAFACASSAATLPVTLRCVKATGKVPDDIRNFVCPLGATVNMDGSAIYFPCACIWLAILNGITPDAGSYILLIILSTIGSAGTAPVPSAGLVLVITAYNTVFGTSGVPNGFEFIVAIDWFLDRCITALNVTGDTVVCGIVAARTPWQEDETNITGPTKMEDGSDHDVECDQN